ncbi:MAG: response regulator transcription factor [Peptoniphilus sp. oral taxon 375]|nr:response regulator transcription factor [Peptoniphilus sp. oral taxon 375]
MIYVVEDDNSIRELILYALEGQNYEVKGFGKPSDFWMGMEEEKPQLILLDIMLPEQDGMDILKKLKSQSQTRDLPVIMLTAKDSEYDMVTGLDTGADDYMTKPFRMMELLSRIGAVLRRSGAKNESVLSLGKLEVDRSRHLAKVDGQEVDLTPKEFDILWILMSRPGYVFSRDTLFQRIWGTDFAGESRTLDVHMGSLRQKLGQEKDHIQTVRGLGYKIV